MNNQEQPIQEPQVGGKILTQQDVVATMQIFVFTNGAAAIQTDNLGPLQAARILSLLSARMIAQSMEQTQIVTP